MRYHIRLWYYHNIWKPFDRHMRQMHKADYEVCPDLLCRLGYWFERITHFEDAFQ